MALMTPGPVVGQVSGRIGGTIFSHNKGGMYIRNGTKPTKVTTELALKFKALMGKVSKEWQRLTAENRAAWVSYAATNSEKNRLGRSISITGQNWFVRCNTRAQAVGGVTLTLPPTIPSPGVSFPTAFTISKSEEEATFTLGAALANANEVLWIRAAVTSTPTKNNIENLFKTVTFYATLPIDPADLYEELEAALGTLQVDQYVSFAYRVVDKSTGLASQEMYARSIVA